MKKYNIGYTCGVFDLFHYGHLKLFERCKSLCEYLIVGVCDDDYVINTKKKTPFFKEIYRYAIIDSLKIVDRTELIDYNLTFDKYLAYKRFKFDVLFSGDDWKGSDRYIKTEEQFKRMKIAIEYFPYTDGISTTMIKKYLISLDKLEKDVNSIKSE